MRAKYFGSLLGIVLASILFTACGTEAGSKEETAVESVQPTMSDDSVQEAEQEIEKVDVVKDFLNNLPDDSYYGCVDYKDGAKLYFVTNFVIGDEETNAKESIDCDVYYYKDNMLRMVGSCMSTSTAQPIKFDGKYLYEGGHRGFMKSKVNTKKYELQTVEMYLISYDKEGNEIVSKEVNNKSVSITREESDAAWDDYLALEPIAFVSKDEAIEVTGYSDTK